MGTGWSSDGGGAAPAKACAARVDAAAPAWGAAPSAGPSSTTDDDAASLSSSLSCSLSDASSGSISSERRSGGCGCAGSGSRSTPRRARRSSSSVSSAASERPPPPPRPPTPDAGAPPAPGFAAGGDVVRSSHAAVTPDGWRLHLHRVRSRASAGGDGADGAGGGAGSGARRYPVVLCPGLATGGIESFDLDDSVSLAAYLAEAGYDVWVPDLRGNGRSQKPSWWDRSTWWTVDDHLLLDMPTVVAAVLAASRARQLHWLGHSMGGMLAVGAVSRGLPCARALRTITLLASGCFGAGSWHEPVGALLTRLAARGFPAGHMVPAMALAPGPLAPLAWLTRALFYAAPNVEPAVGRKLMRTFLSFIPPGVVAQFLGSLNSPLGMSSSCGTWNYADPKVLAHDTRPVLGITGDRDMFCPASGGLKTVNLFGGPHRRFLFLGPRYGTARHAHGHFCPLIGKRAREEVFPHLAAFLDEFDAPAAAWPCAACAGGRAAPAPLRGAADAGGGASAGAR